MQICGRGGGLGGEMLDLREKWGKGEGGGGGG